MQLSQAMARAPLIRNRAASGARYQLYSGAQFTAAHSQQSPTETREWT